MEQPQTPPVIEVRHTLDRQQLEEISSQVYETTIGAIKQARHDADLDSDILLSKAAVCRWLQISPNYLEELLAAGLPRGRKLSDRREVFFKSDIKKFLKTQN